MALVKKRKDEGDEEEEDEDEDAKSDKMEKGRNHESSNYCHYIISCQDLMYYF